MFEPSLHIGSITLSSYSTLIGIGIVLSMLYVLKPVPANKRLKTLDVLIAGLIGAIVVARIVHVILNWNYFAYNTEEIIQIAQGGLDWHGAVFGAIAGMMLMSRWRSISLKSVLDRLTLAVPLLALMSWWGCWTASCAYGAEIYSLADYPSWMVWEGRDVFGIYAPRFHTQLLGMGLSIFLLLVAVVLIWRKLLMGRRLYLLLCLLGLSMFLLGFLRGDYALSLNGLRLDQYLDVYVMSMAGISMIRYYHR